MSKIALCGTCKNEPLVMTFYFSKKEFVCLRCGRLYEFFGPTPAEETPELLAKMEERKAEWQENASGLLNDHSWREGCAQCKVGGDYHIAHATAEEKTAHEKAWLWLLERTGKAVAA